MTKSIEDLKAAFAGESQANRKYLAFAEKAEKEGFLQAARLFRAAAAAETVHAHNHLRAMDGIKSTAENLEEAMSGEDYEAETMYPDFINDAKLEDEKRALRSFVHAMEVEKQHRARKSMSIMSAPSAVQPTAAPHRKPARCAAQMAAAS
jgi:rubrerythrin